MSNLKHVSGVHSLMYEFIVIHGEVMKLLATLPKRNSVRVDIHIVERKKGGKSKRKGLNFIKFHLIPVWINGKFANDVSKRDYMMNMGERTRFTSR